MQRIAGIVLAAAGLWLGALPRAVGADSQAATKKKTGTTTQRTGSRKSSTRRARFAHSRRRVRYRVRLAQLKMQPQRVEEIQQALIRTGYLKEEATGKWDDPTREAMRRYQEDNGFPTTGLPEAKTLMKLGLGAHPLPEDADPASDRRASVEAQPPESTSPGASPPQQDPH